MESTHKKALEEHSQKYEEKINSLEKINVGKIKAVQDVLTNQNDTVVKESIKSKFLTNKD